MSILHELGQAEGLGQPCLVQPFSPFSLANMEQAQRGLDTEQMQQQQLKLRDRQKFFEEVFQHDVDFFFPMSHLQIEHRRRKCCRHQHGARGVSGNSDTGDRDWWGIPSLKAAGDRHVLH